MFLFFSFFSSVIFPRKKAKGDVSFFLKSFSVVVLEGFVGCFFFLCHFFQGKRKRKAPSAKSCLCKRWAFLGQRVHHPHRLESRCLPASQPAILAGRSHNKPILGKGPLVDFQIVRDRRERWTEGEPDPREGEDVGEKGAGERGGRCSWAEAAVERPRRSGKEREAPAGSWRSEAPQQHRHTLWLRSPTGGKPRSSELPERLPRHPSQGDTQGTRWGHTEQTCFGKSRRTSSNNLKLDIYI